MFEQKLELRTGALAPSLKEQLTSQGLPFNKEAIKALQEDLNCINRLRITLLLPEATKEILHKKFFKNLVDHINSEIKLMQSKPAKKKKNITTK